MYICVSIHKHERESRPTNTMDAGRTKSCGTFFIQKKLEANDDSRFSHSRWVEHCIVEMYFSRFGLCVVVVLIALHAKSRKDAVRARGQVAYRPNRMDGWMSDPEARKRFPQRNRLQNS